MTNATQTHDQLRDEIRDYITESFFGKRREQALGIHEDLLARSTRCNYSAWSSNSKIATRSPLRTPI